MQGLDPAVHDLGKSGDIGNIAHRNTGVGNGARSAPGGDQLNARALRALAKSISPVFSETEIRARFIGCSDSDMEFVPRFMFGPADSMLSSRNEALPLLSTGSNATLKTLSNSAVVWFRNRPLWLRLAMGAGLVLLIAYAGLFWFLRNPVVFGAAVSPGPAADVERLTRDVWALTSIKPSRSFRNPAALSLAGSYIETEFAESGCAVDEQKVPFFGNMYRNITCSFGPRDGPRVIVGAHYDVHGANNPGADDNASGVAGILEIARLVGAAKPTLAYRLDLVAYTLEEVRGDVDGAEQVNIGSYFHARDLEQRDVDVKLMISVEMIGFFSSEAELPGLSPAVVRPAEAGLSRHRGLHRYHRAGVRPVTGVTGQRPDERFGHAAGLLDQRAGLSFPRSTAPTTRISGPRIIQPSWSPIPRNSGTPTITSSSDAADTLDYLRMAKVVEGLYQVAVGY